MFRRKCRSGERLRWDCVDGLRRLNNPWRNVLKDKRSFTMQLLQLFDSLNRFFQFNANRRPNGLFPRYSQLAPAQVRPRILRRRKY